MFYPSHINIENVAGACTARCIMCPIDNSPRKGVMKHDTFLSVLQRLDAFRDRLQMFTFVGLGETLLDPGIDRKVAALKSRSYPGVGVVTNGTLLTGERSESLLAAGLDTIIISIDGVRKETHEAIRSGTSFETIRENTLHFIESRNNKGSTKIIVRMILQELNASERDAFFDYWNSRLDSRFGDMVAFYDVHNFGLLDNGRSVEQEIEEFSCATKIICPDLLNRMIIKLDGDMDLCCGAGGGIPAVGNIFTEDPLSLYNGRLFSKYRNRMAAGKLHTLQYCRNCQIILSSMKSRYIPVKRSSQ